MQRYQWASVQLPAMEEDILIRIGCGALMGDQYPVRSFLASYETATCQLNLELSFLLSTDDNQFFYCRSPVEDEPSRDLTDLSLSKYADDVTKSVLAPKDSSVQQLFEVTEQASTSLSNLLDTDRTETNWLQFSRRQGQGQERPSETSPAKRSLHPSNAPWPLAASGLWCHMMGQVSTRSIARFGRCRRRPFAGVPCGPASVFLGGCVGWCSLVKFKDVPWLV